MPGPLPISPDTAIKLSKHLGVPIEHLMHMPRHILLQRLAEMAAREQAQAQADERAPEKEPTPPDKPDKDGSL